MILPVSMGGISMGELSFYEGWSIGVLCSALFVTVSINWLGCDWPLVVFVLCIMAIACGFVRRIVCGFFRLIKERGEKDV